MIKRVSEENFWDKRMWPFLKLSLRRIEWLRQSLPFEPLLGLHDTFKGPHSLPHVDCYSFFLFCSSLLKILFCLLSLGGGGGGLTCSPALLPSLALVSTLQLLAA